ncbi:hypothetical protein MRB53_033039 [Persea americana]|uniref:Uncharacterized protein n=1 Tax=Persea americana TaxID=3435 RepID=A0ACC2KUQ6_PERAE|nr:hypothetical protein MRB53_033039 [Persea americana]
MASSSSAKTTISNAKFEVKKFDGTNNFGMWQCEFFGVFAFIAFLSVRGPNENLDLLIIFSFPYLRQILRECGKMWWSTEKTCDANSLSALYEFPLFILDEIGGQAVCSSLLCAQMHNGAPSYIKPVVLKNDLCEDG